MRLSWDNGETILGVENIYYKYKKYRGYIIQTIVILTTNIRGIMETTKKDFATYQFKIPQELWTKFKIKSISENSPTYRETLINLIKEYVGRDVHWDLSRIPSS